jgi:hypothetical protein
MRHRIAVKYGVLEARVAKIKTDGDHERSKVKGKLNRSSYFIRGQICTFYQVLAKYNFLYPAKSQNCC